MNLYGGVCVGGNCATCTWDFPTATTPPCDDTDPMQQSLATPILQATVPGSTTAGVVECRITGTITFQVDDGTISTGGNYFFIADLSVDSGVSRWGDPNAGNEISIGRGREGTTFVERYELIASFDRSTADTSYYARVHQSGDGPRDAAGNNIGVLVTHSPTTLSCVSFDLL